LKDWENKLEELKSLRGDTDEGTMSNLIVGQTLSWELMSVVYNGRQCYSDFGTIGLIPERQPETHTFSGAPSETFLDRLEWKGVNGWSELQF